MVFLIFIYFQARGIFFIPYPILWSSTVQVNTVRPTLTKLVYAVTICPTLTQPVPAFTIRPTLTPWVYAQCSYYLPHPNPAGICTMQLIFAIGTVPPTLTKLVYAVTILPTLTQPLNAVTIRPTLTQLVYAVTILPTLTQLVYCMQLLFAPP